MSIAKVLLPMSGAAAGPAADLAFAVAARFGARVEGLHPSLPALDRLKLADDAGVVGQLQRLIQEAQGQVRQEEERARLAFETVATTHGAVASAFVSLEGDRAAIVGRRGRLADLTIVPVATRRDGDFWTEVREGALFQTGRPVVVAPDQTVSASVGDTVVVAWKDGVEAARALTAAKPFIAKAKRVRVVSVGGDEDDARSLGEAKDYLALLGVKVDSASIDPGRRDVGQVLVEQAGKDDDGLLVMGAYSQWRWREWALGGVTEHVLHKTTVPVLMTH